MLWLIGTGFIVYSGYCYHLISKCSDLVTRGKVDATVPNPFIRDQATRQFMDFVLRGKYRISKDSAVLRTFTTLRVILIANVIIMVAGVVFALGHAIWPG